jgi:HAD superfamily hydrolase (TIGR01509 family)
MSRRRAPPRAVVFDFDGTLIDSLPLVLAAITHAVEGHGPRPTMEIFAGLGGPPERFLGPLLHDGRHLPMALERLAAFHRENSHLMQPFAGAGAALDALRAAGVRVAVWTGRDRTSAQRLLAQHGWQGRFAAFVCGDDLDTHKPDPAGLRAILRALDVAPAEALLVGDADVDVLGGAAAGVATLMIHHGRAVAAEVAARAWRLAASPAEAYAVVLGLLEQDSAPA